MKNMKDKNPVPGDHEIYNCNRQVHSLTFLFTQFV